MRKIQKLLANWLFPKFISNACESRIPRSGAAGANVNCFVLAIDNNESPFFIATEISGDQISGLEWDGNSYANETILTVQEIENKNLRITHYYGLCEITYKGICDAAFHYTTKWAYIKIWLHKKLDSISQYLFNKKKLVTKKRIELLNFMMDSQLDRSHAGISFHQLMTGLYSINWILHPAREEQERRLELYLESLVNSGEISQINHEYVVTGSAISAIERYEEEERRHTEAVKLQKRMVLLTLILVFTALVQSGVIKLPVLIDLTQKSQQEESTYNYTLNPARFAHWTHKSYAFVRRLA